MQKIILDCDPGHDDAFAIMLACSHFNVLGITTVGGNGYLPNVTRNALQVLEVLGKTEIPVYPGHAGPAIQELTIADNVHGSSGMDGPHLPEPTISAQSEHAVDFIVRSAMNEEDLILIATGPLTNIAAALHRQPEIAQRIRALYFMGGGAYCGNWTPAAEFNIWVDPEAAYTVFHSKMPLYMAGVNLTRQCPVLKEDIETIRSFGNQTGKFAAELLDFFAKDGDAHLHDACAVAWVVDPSLVKDAFLHVDVELNGTLTRGMTVTDLRVLQSADCEKDLDLDSLKRWNDAPEDSPFRGLQPNTHVGMRLDFNRFRQLLFSTLQACR